MREPRHIRSNFLGRERILALVLAPGTCRKGQTERLKRVVETENVWNREGITDPSCERAVLFSVFPVQCERSGRGLTNRTVRCEHING